MDATELGQSALVGWRERVASRVARPVSRRTGVGERQLRSVMALRSSRLAPITL